MSELKKIKIGEATFSYSPEKAYMKNGNIHCKTCHEQINGEQIEFLGAWMIFPRQCRCQRDEEQRWKAHERAMNVQRLRDVCFTNPAQKDMTFEKCLIKSSQAFKVAFNYVNKFNEMQERNIGLLFSGTIGSGKSYLAAAIANEIMDEYLISCKMRNFSQIINDLQSGGFELDKNRYIDSLIRTPLLVLDDLGIERQTPYALEQVYNIINGRSQQNKPTIITTNLNIEVLKTHKEEIETQRIYSRVMEMCIPVRLRGDDIRQQIHQQKFVEAQKLLVERGESR